MNCYDLHSHSTCSDGALSPGQLVAAAHAAGVTHLALTDHDTIAGVAETLAAAEKYSLKCITGIEFSCQWRNRSIHVVGLNVDIKQPELLAVTADMALRRDQRNSEIAASLARLGFENCLQGARDLALGEQVGRPHFAQHLVNVGAVKNVNQAFKRFLGTGKVGDVRHQWPELATVVQWILAAGGVAVIAHPLKYQLTRTKIIHLCKEFKAAGGQAMEVVSGCHQSPQQTTDIASICNKLALKASIGSDFHRPGVAWQALGRCGQLPEQVDPVWSMWR